MNFRELLEKYKTGTATEEERLLVEEEIEKSELINEYLSEQMEPLPPLESLEKDFSGDAKKISTALNRRIGAAVLAAVLGIGVIAAAIKYIALPAYDAQFYNPHEVAEGVPDIREEDEAAPYKKEFTPLFITTEVFLDLYCPGWMVQQEEVQSLGMGEYEVWISLTNGRKTKDYSARLVKGEIQQKLNKEWFFPTFTSGRFYDKGSDNFIVEYVNDDGTSSRKQPADSRSNYREELKELPESCIIEANISFVDNMSIEELLAWQEDLGEGLDVNWVGVETGEDCHLDEIGFDVQSGGMLLETTAEFDALFPYLQVTSQNSDDSAMAEIYEQHYKSMLKYMSYQADFLRAFCDVNNLDGVQEYSNALDYAEEHGVSIYGAVISGSRDSMLELEQRAEINSFQISDVMLSAYSD